MALDSKNLARLNRIADPRTVWANEASDFTPWLAENIDVLGEELGMTLSVVNTEVWVGDFKLDIQAADEQGRVVVIENQLDKTDHGHLGQCMVYASGLSATTVVWVAPHFREEYRNALDWLNEHTDQHIGFFGVEIGLVQIENGPMAPVFDVVARPNEWSKAVKATTNAPVTQLNAARQDLFANILESAIEEQLPIKLPKPGSLNYVTFASGPFGYWTLSIDKTGRLRVEAYLDKGSHDLNKALFDELHAAAAEWEAKIGFSLSWERLDDSRASRLAAYGMTTVDVHDDASHEEARQWGTSALVAMFAALNAHLRHRAAALKAADAQVAQAPAGDTAAQTVGDVGTLQP